MTPKKTTSDPARTTTMGLFTDADEMFSAAKVTKRAIKD